MKLKLAPSLILQFLAVAAVFLFVAQPVFHDGLFHVYDNVQVTRTMAVYDELLAGQFPVRFFGTFGHGAGYFLLKYYSPIVYYLAAFFHLIGLTFIQAIKATYLVFLTLGTVGIWLLLRSLVSRFSSTIGTLAFLLAPYLYHDFFHRGSLTEASAMILLPWVLWAFLKLRETQSLPYLGLAGFSLGLTLLTHSLVGLMAVLLVTILLILPPRSWATVRLLTFALLLGFGLAAFSFLPALLDKGLVNYTGNSLVERGYLDHPVRFWSNFKGVGDGSVKTAFLGIPLFISYFVLIWLVLKSKKFRQQAGSLAAWAVLVMTAGFFIMSPASAWVWERVESLRYTQFPFRFLTIVTFAAVVGYSLIFEHFKKSKLLTFMLAALLLLQLVVYPRFYQPLGYQYGTEYKIEDPCMTTGWADEHLPKWVKKCLLAPIPLVTPLEGNVVIEDMKDLNNGSIVKFRASGSGNVQIAKYYFPNWQARDGQKLEPSGEHGLIKMAVSGDQVEYSLHYLETPLEKASDYLSIVSLLFVLYTLRYAYRH